MASCKTPFVCTLIMVVKLSIMLLSVTQETKALYMLKIMSCWMNDYALNYAKVR